MKIRSFLVVLLVGAFALTSVYFYANMKLTEKEYREYRNGIFARAYESLIADLTSYRRSEDGALAARIAARLSELPLSSGETDTARRFASDMAAGGYDADAKARALSYAEDLLRYLSVNRSASYEAGRRAAGLGLPSYPEKSLPTAALPEKEPDVDALRRETASRLLGSRSTVAYTREENGAAYYGYRTASSFAELTEEGRLTRLLLARNNEAPPPSEEEAAVTAKAFLTEQGRQDALLSAPEAADNALLFPFSCGEEEGLVGVAAEGVFLFRSGA